MFTEEMNAYLLAQRERCEARAEALAGESREDEAVFEKIRLNVFEIFRTVLSAAKTATGSPEEALRFFSDRLRQIPEAWEKSLAAAQSHGDGVKAHIEKLKLDAVAQIRREAEKMEEWL